MKKKYRIVNKKRFFIFVTSVFTVITVILLSFLFKDKAHSFVHEVEFYEIKIKEGDTLWDIVSRNLPEETDIRKAVYDLQKFNEIDSGYIFPGDVIKIPVKNKY